MTFVIALEFVALDSSGRHSRDDLADLNTMGDCQLIYLMATATAPRTQKSWSAVVHSLVDVVDGDAV